MTKEKAIQILTRQRDKLDNPQYSKDQIWVIQTIEYVRQFFGETSPQYTYISNFTFGAFYPRTEEHRQKQIKEHPLQVKQFLTDCIELIKDNGLHKPPATNFLHGYSSTQIIIGSIPILTILVSIVFYLGQLKLDREKLQLIERNKTLKDSLSLFVVPIIRPDTNTTHYEDTAHRADHNTK